MSALLEEDVFFPRQPDVDLDDIAGYEYPEPLPDEPVTQDEVDAVMQKLSPLRTPGPTQTRYLATRPARVDLGGEDLKKARSNV